MERLIMDRFHCPWFVRARRGTVAAGLLLLAACSETSSPASPQPPPPEVSVIPAQSQSVPITRELVGRLAATRIAEVRARVAGIVLARTYSEGTDVKQGQVLFRIDPAPLEAALHAAQAALAQVKANAANAAATAKRYSGLAPKGLASRQDLDNALANERTTAAAVKQALANVEQARLDLDYATVTAPIAGRAGRALVTEGALVGQDTATQLTSVEQIDPIYVNFSQPIVELEQLQRSAKQVETALGPEHKTKIQVLLPDGTPYPYEGALDSSDLAVEPATGALSLRGIVPNPERRLLPGMFVKLRLTEGHIKNAFVLPQAAVQRDNAGAYVLVVNTSGQVGQRRVQTHHMTDADWVVTGAL
ncbi:MAG: efflux RND transporter periplasmic adaptor subunit, partial [Gammaproteobacteria bacterium]